MFENILPSQLENIHHCFTWNIVGVENCDSRNIDIAKDITLDLGIILQLCVKLTLEWARWVPHRLAFLNLNVTVSM